MLSLIRKDKTKMVRRAWTIAGEGEVVETDNSSTGMIGMTIAIANRAAAVAEAEEETDISTMAVAIPDISVVVAADRVDRADQGAAVLIQTPATVSQWYPSPRTRRQLAGSIRSATEDSFDARATATSRKRAMHSSPATSQDSMDCAEAMRCMRRRDTIRATALS